MSKVRFQPAETAPDRKGFALRQPAASAALSRMVPGHPWVYAHYPSRWRVEGGEIVPDLVQISLQPGVGNTGAEDGTGGGRPDGAILAATARGATVFTDTTLDGGLGGDSYVDGVRVQKGRVWVDYSATPIANSIQLRIDADKRMTMLRAFRDLVLPPEEHVIMANIDRVERDHAAAFEGADRNPIKQRQADKLAAELDVWRAALEQSTTTPILRAAKPKPTRRRASKPSAPEE